MTYRGLPKKETPHQKQFTWIIMAINKENVDKSYVFVLSQMALARNPDGSSMFDSSEYLTPKQIKRWEAKADSSEDEMEEDEEA